MKLFVVTYLVWITQCESFLRCPSDLDSQYKANVNVDVTEGRRTRRSTDNSFHPQSYDLDIQVDGSIVQLHLIRNDELHTSVPTLSLDRGDLTEQVYGDTEESIFYQDIHLGAAFVVQYDKQLSRNMFGTFNTAEGGYILQTKNISNSSINRGFNQFEIIKEKQQRVEFDDFIPHGEHLKIGQHRRHKRATGAHQIELLIVCDYSVYKYWYDKSTKLTSNEKETEALVSVRQFYAFIINGMDAMYKNIQTSSYTISVVFAGIIISKSPADATWTETIKNTAVSPNQVDSTKGLDNFRTWIQANTGLPGNDHAMLFTKYDLTSSGSTGNAGLAYTAATCTSRSQSIVEDGFNFIMITTASHELGHSLSAAHDGEGNACFFSDAYIMAASSSPQQSTITAAHPWIFSSCSTFYFTTYINALDGASNNCMKTVSSSFDPTALAPYDQNLAGQVYDADAQCVNLYSSNSYMCRGLYSNNDFSTLCSVLWCYDPTVPGSTCRTHIAGEGTLCGSKKWCVSGVCTSDVNAPAGNDNCLYGDKKGVIFGNGWTCADMIINGPNNCNTPAVSAMCCASCAPPTTAPITTQAETTTTDTTTQLETTTLEVTTTQEATTTQEVTTQEAIATQGVTTIQADTTTQGVTTTQADTTTREATTTEGATTTERVTTTQGVTTIQADTTTQGVTTIQADTTTQGVTTTQADTTTQGVTTTQADTTTREATTEGVTTTERVTTTQGVTTIQEATPTQEATTTEGVTTTEGITTMQRATTTQGVTTTQEDTPTEGVTTAHTETASQSPVTTEREQITEKVTTTQQDTTTTDSSFNDSEMIAEYILIGFGTSLCAVFALVIVVGCVRRRFTAPPRKQHDRAELYPYMANGNVNPVSIYDVSTVNRPSNKSNKGIPYDTHGGTLHFPPTSNLPKRGYYNQGTSYLHPPVRYPKYNIQSTFSWSEVLPNGGYVNNGFKTEGYQNERYQNRGFQDNIYDKDDFYFESGRHKTDNNNFYNGVGNYQNRTEHQNVAYKNGGFQNDRYPKSIYQIGAYQNDGYHNERHTNAGYKNMMYYY